MILAKITDSTSDKGVTYSEVVSGAGSTLDKVAYVVVPGAALAKFTSAIKFSGISVVEKWVQATRFFPVLPNTAQHGRRVEIPHGEDILAVARQQLLQSDLRQFNLADHIPPAGKPAKSTEKLIRGLNFSFIEPLVSRGFLLLPFLFLFVFI